MAENTAGVRSMSDHAREAAKLIARDQQKRPGKKVRVVAIADGFDGFKYREEGERFIAWWPDEIETLVKDKATGQLVKTMVPCTPPSWQMKEEEYDRRRKAEAKVAKETAGVGE